MKGVVKLIKVLFVCLGNICRSPMAEAVFRDMIEKNQLTHKISVDSAGTAGWHMNKPPHEGTRDLLDRIGVSYDGQKARQLQKTDFANFDYIIAMDAQNIADMQAVFLNKDDPAIAKMTDYITDPKETNVPDPYYTGDFDYTYELIALGCEGLLNHIKDKHNI